jgi:hypothetical protein
MAVFRIIYMGVNAPLKYLREIRLRIWLVESTGHKHVEECRYVPNVK